VARRWPHEPQNRSVDQIRSARDRSLALSDERAAKDTAHLVWMVPQPRQRVCALAGLDAVLG